MNNIRLLIAVFLAVNSASTLAITPTDITTKPVNPLEPEGPSVPIDTSLFKPHGWPEGRDRDKGIQFNHYNPTALPESSENYVMTMTVLNENATDAVVSVQYYDGLGYPSQSVVGGLNPQGKYLHSLNEYDALGNVVRSWCPVVGKGLPTIMTERELKSASATLYDGDAYGYTSMKYDLQGRPTETVQPGRAWQGKPRMVTYGANDANMVKKYVLQSSKPVQQGYYPQGSLSCETRTDEDGKKVETFTDLQGRTVLERRGGSVCTYYVYNPTGQLTFVLSPMYQGQPDVDLFAYQYTYDERGRVKTKKLPGCETVEYWYDGADRLVKMQDGLLREAGKYRVYAYDGLGRLKTQSISNGSRVEYDEIENFYDTYDYMYLKLHCNQNLSYFSINHETAYIPNSVYDYIVRDAESGKGQLTATELRASNGEYLLSLFVYDGKGRMKRKAEFGLDKHLSVTDYTYTFFDAVRSETVSEYALVDKTYNYVYDNDTDVKALEKRDTLELDETSYLKTKEVSIANFFDHPHTKLLGSSVITIRDIVHGQTMTDTISKFTYDEFGKMVANDRSGTAGDMSYEYDNLHGWLIETTAKGGFEQTLLRETGARESCFNGSISAMEWKCGKDIKRRYDYVYDGLNRLDYAHYSSYQADWAQTRAGSTPTMRLIPGDWRNGDYSVCYDYDANSNLLEAERQGWACVDEDGNDVYDTVDDVMIEYNGNQRKSATLFTVTDDDYYGKMTFVNGAEKSVEYAYDGNGNLTRDDNKGITNIEYDLLSNPRKVTMTGQRSIEYVYAADGRKLRTIHSRRTAERYGHNYWTFKTIETKTDYINNYIFKDDKPEMFRFDGGYYSFDEEGKMDGCHLYVQDYQGNNRMVVNAYTNSIEQISHYYPYGALMGDISTQPEAQDFKYSGKELDRTYGLDLYDFHARQYDPLIPGFNSMDPKSEHFYGYSPYSYCGGDPINRTDKTGEFFDVIWDIANVAMDVTSAIDNFSNGNVVSGLIDVGACIADVGAAIVPCVPGGVGAALKASRAADKVLDATKALDKASDAVKTADNVTDAVKSTDKTTDALSAMKRGKESEARVLDDMGLTKNTKSQTVNVPNTGKVTTIPDAETATAVYEIKDAKNVYNTKQIQAERIHAKKTGKQFFIIVGENTHVSKNIPENEIIRRSDLGPR